MNDMLEKRISSYCQYMIRTLVNWKCVLDARIFPLTAFTNIQSAWIEKSVFNYINIKWTCHNHSSLLYKEKIFFPQSKAVNNIKSPRTLHFGGLRKNLPWLFGSRFYEGNFSRRYQLLDNLKMFPSLLSKSTPLSEN